MNEEKRTSAAAILLALLKAGCYLLLFLGAQTLVTVAVTAIITIWSILNGGGLDQNALLTDVLAYTPHITLFSAVLTLIILAIFFLARKKKLFAEVGLVRTKPSLVGAAAAITPALYVVVIVVMGFLPEALLEDYAQASAGLDDTGLFTLLATVIAAPIVEEVIFRGLIQSRLARAMPGWLAAVIAALVFGLCHGQIVWATYAFVLGLFFGWMRLRSGSILPSLAAHFVFNLIGHFAVVLEGAVPDWAILVGLLVISAIACLLTRRGLGELLHRKQPEVS